jgi:dimethylhistidine N-methyltransferase
LIEACLRRQSTLDYWAVDYAPAAMADAARPLLADYPELRFFGLAGEFDDGLRFLAQAGGPPRLVAFLGSTIGNFDDSEIARFFTLLRSSLRPQDRFLLGFDVLKDPAILVAAYDDAQGVTAAFNRNLLVRINRELDANFNVEAFAHQAVFNAARSRIEMHLVSQRTQEVRVGFLGLNVVFRAGETIHTENCCKHSQEAMRALLRQHGFAVTEAFTDERQWFCLYLCA